MNGRKNSFKLSVWGLNILNVVESVENQPYVHCYREKAHNYCIKIKIRILIV